MTNLKLRHFQNCDSSKFATILNLRQIQNFQQIKNASNLNLRKIENCNSSKFPKNLKLFSRCSSGSRSALVHSRSVSKYQLQHSGPKLFWKSRRKLSMPLSGRISPQRLSRHLRRHRRVLLRKLLPVRMRESTRQLQVHVPGRKSTAR